jgi:hypothetical protein
MWIDDLYGVTFPPSLEQFHRFWTRQTDDRFGEALGVSLTGPLDLLDRYSSIDEIEVTPTILVHWRFFSDPPELFTCLHGDADGLHFGLLLDDPGRGFRGAAGYYSNDGDVIAEYKGLFHLLASRIDDRIAGAEEMIEDDPECAEDYEADIVSLRRLDAGLKEFLVDEGIRLDEGRGRTIPTDTGLGVVPPGGVREWAERMPAGLDTSGTVPDLLDRCRRGDPLPALAAGRSRWYWGGREATDEAHQVMAAAYAELGHRFLGQVLDAHREYRDLPSVDCVRPR